MCGMISLFWNFLHSSVTCDCITIRIIDSKLEFILFLFLFIFYLEKLGLGFSMILHITSFPLTTILHGSAYWKVCE